MNPDYTIVSLMSLETCFGCRGRGSVGHAGEWNIICEVCGGCGHVFRERAALIREEEGEGEIIP